VAQSPSKDGTKADLAPKKPVPPPMQSVLKGGWTYRIENPIETCVSALKELAQQVRADSWAFVRYGPKMLSPAETQARQQEIAALAAEIEKLAAEMPKQSVPFPRVTEILSKLHKLGFFPNGLLIENVARAFVSAERFRRPGETALE
jgi:phosphoglycolate phosphatase-like HAD superfamily hydrolase